MTKLHRGEQRVYLMSLATQVVVRCSILRSKFANYRLLAGLHSDPLGELTAFPQTL